MNGLAHAAHDASVLPLVDHEQALLALGIGLGGSHQAAAGGELVYPGRRHVQAAGGRDDRVVRGVGRMPRRPSP